MNLIEEPSVSKFRPFFKMRGLRTWRTWPKQLEGRGVNRHAPIENKRRKGLNGGDTICSPK